MSLISAGSISLDSTFKETAEIETGMAEKSSWDQAKRRQKLGLVWRNRKKISQIIKDYFYLSFFLLIILCWHPTTASLPSPDPPYFSLQATVKVVRSVVSLE